MLITTPERLAYVRVLTIKDSANALLNELQSLGVIHPERVAKIPEEDRVRLQRELEGLRKLESIVTNFETLIKKPKLVEVKEVIEAADLGKYVKDLLERLSRAYEKVTTIESNLERLKEDLAEHQRLMLVLRAISSDPELGTKYLDDISFQGLIVSSAILLGSESGFKGLEGLIRDKGLDIYIIRRLQLNEDTYTYIIAGPTYCVEEVVFQAKKFNVVRVAIPSKHVKVKEFLRDVEARVNLIKQMIRDATDNLNKLLSTAVNDIAIAKIVSKLWGERVNVLLEGLAGDYLVAIEGWVPVAQLLPLENQLYSKLKYVYVAKVNTKANPPTKMRNPKLLRPFEMITKIYGIPNYKEWDPTPIISYSLLLFFGLMFADVVYGVVMFIIVNFILERTGLIDNPYSEGYLTFKRMLTFLSVSSMLFGFLSNSYAGYSIILSDSGITLKVSTGAVSQSILPILNPMFFIKLALIIGLVHINIAHSISMAKFIKERNKGAILSKAGFFIAEAFGIPYVLYAFLKYQLPGLTPQSYNYMFYGALTGLALLIAGKFVTYRALGALFWLFDLTGFLGDVMSYTRLAGLGLATSLLAQSFNSLALGVAAALQAYIPIAVVGLVVGSLLALVVAVLANLLNVTFGIIGAFIHSLRLCFVEFLPKFYEGNGREFQPFSLKVERAVYVGSASKA